MTDNLPNDPQSIMAESGYVDLEVIMTEGSAAGQSTAEHTAEAMHKLTGLPHTVRAKRNSGYGVYVRIEKDNLMPEHGLTLEDLISQLKYQARGVKAGIRHTEARPTARLRGLVEGAAGGMGVKTLDIVSTDEPSDAHDLAAAMCREFGIDVQVLSVDAYIYTVSVINAEAISFAGHALLRTYAQGYLDGYLDGHASNGYDGPDDDESLDGIREYIGNEGDLP